MLTLAALLAIAPLTGPASGLAPDAALLRASPHASSPATAAMPIAHMAPPPSRNRGISIRIPAARPGPPTPRIDGPRDPSRPLIVIDPGHGGHDPGAHNDHLDWREKDLTLAIAIAVRDALLQSGRVRVALTREDDSFLALEERSGLARQMGADLFISIHADASPDRDARGATIYTLSEAPSDQEAGQLAARENRADMLGGVNLSGRSNAVSSILLDLAQRETMAASSRFADLLHREAGPFVPFRDPFQRRAALVVLKSPDVPSILFETGYLTNDAEAGWLAGDEEQGRIADGIARAVAVYVATLPAKTAPEKPAGK